MGFPVAGVLALVADLLSGVSSDSGFINGF